MRLSLVSPPFQNRLDYAVAEPWRGFADWPASWLVPPTDWVKPWVAAFRCSFSLTERTRDRLHVSADERYELYLDGQWIGRGAERGDKSHWYYDSYSVDLKPGAHMLVACVWAMGPLEPWAQMSVAPGFLCSPEKETLIAKVATGVGAWEILKRNDRTFRDMSPGAGTAMGGGPSETLDARLTSWGWESGQGTGWSPAAIGAKGNHGFHPHSTRAVHWLCPSPLPQQLNKPWKSFRIFKLESPAVTADSWLALFKKQKPLTLPARTNFKLLIDLEDYLCAYPELHWSGGAGSRISLGWAEALRDPVTNEKRHGTVAEDSRFVGPCDEVIPDGGAARSWRPLWWRCGCYVQLEIVTGDEALTLDRFALFETRYPLKVESRWQVPDVVLSKVLAVSRRTLELCMHETYMDCPYYEQLMYVGDTRLQTLLTYALTRDDRLPRKALELYDSSRLNPTGIVACAHPNNGGQLIPPFALWWVAMIYDFARWRGDRDFIRQRLPGVRALLDHFRQQVDATGVLRGPTGWNFLDWTFQPGGVAPGGFPSGQNAGLQAQWTLVLGQVAALESYAGEPEMVARYSRWEREAKQALLATFWDEKRGLIADDATHANYSEHGQCLALLAGVLNAKRQSQVWKTLERGEGLVLVSSYFAHYLFEACVRCGRVDRLMERLAPWRQCVQEGFRTMPETFGQTRSDCHAWSAHPLYHYLTGILGIQPGEFGFATVVIAPQLGELPEASGELAHPLGNIRVAFQKRGNKLTADIELPKGLTGTFRASGKVKPLRAGKQKIVCAD